MANYYDRQCYIGESHMACLDFEVSDPVFHLFDARFTIEFGCHGSYGAYLVEDETLIPDSYTLVAYTRIGGVRDLKILSDHGVITKAFSVTGDHIAVYRCRDFGCIISAESITEVRDD